MVAVSEALDARYLVFSLRCCEIAADEIYRSSEAPFMTWQIEYVIFGFARAIGLEISVPGKPWKSPLP